MKRFLTTAVLAFALAAPAAAHMIQPNPGSANKDAADRDRDARYCGPGGEMYASHSGAVECVDSKTGKHYELFDGKRVPVTGFGQ